MSVVELTPVVKSVDVRRAPMEAFRIFTEQISAWWPLATRTRARTAAGEVTVAVTVEPRVGGRVYETLNDGRELEWGDVARFEPGAHFAMNWTMGRPAEQSTLVSVRFEALGEVSCRVTLTHENWERLAEDASKVREAYNNGWADVLEVRFGGFSGLV